MRPRSLTAVLALAGALAGIPGPQVTLAAQLQGPAAGEAARGSLPSDPSSRITLQHSFPLAGRTLFLVVDGLAPHEDVALQLSDPADAPRSVMRYLADPNSEQAMPGMQFDAPGQFTSVWRADEQGRVVFSIALTDPDDGNRPITLRAQAPGRGASEPLHLQVQPPTLVLAARDGLQRISLLDGSLLQPAIPADGGLRGVAFSSNGVLGYVLREGGLLETRSTKHWDAGPLSRRALDPAADVLAGSLFGGAAFAVVRPAGTPFTPSAQLVFLDETRAPLLLEPMGQAVAGRRVVLTPDGLSAFVAEDNLIVREVDLISGRARELLTVGLAGDGAIADLVLDGRRLLVATRGPLGRRGSLTSFDLDSGVLLTHALRIDPLRLVALAPGSVLVIPAADGRLQMVESGLPTSEHAAVGGRWLDAVAWDGGALLLREAGDGARVLESFDPDTGRSATLIASDVPPVTRMIGADAGGDTEASIDDGVVVLLGDPSGAVHVLRSGATELETVPGVEALPGESFAILP